MRESIEFKRYIKFYGKTKNILIYRNNELVFQGLPHDYWGNPGDVYRKLFSYPKEIFCGYLIEDHYE